MFSSNLNYFKEKEIPSSEINPPKPTTEQEGGTTYVF